MSRILPHLSYQDLRNPLLLQARYADMGEDYYWSEDFSPEFYIAQAQAGFIAVTEQRKGRELLLPELQRSYAVLDFNNLHISRHAQRIIRRDAPTLYVGLSLRTVATRIQRYHKHSWLSARYLETLEAINAHKNDMHVVSVLLYHRGEISAGEIGYILGRTYTSLSGFSSRHPDLRHHGTAQLVLLGQWLKHHQFALWNLGQPYMPYKFALGAREHSRHAFLRQWLPATQTVLVSPPDTPVTYRRGAETFPQDFLL